MSSVSFKSGHTLWKQTDKMVDNPGWETGSVQYALRLKSDFYYRNIIDCIKYLLRQRAYVTYVHWEPVKLFNSDNERIYYDMNTGSWWWDQQRLIPIGSMLVPVLLVLDQTHLTNFSRDKKLWPVYMSIGNINSSVCNKPSMHAWIPIALLPIPPKRLDKIPGNPTEAQELDAL